MTSASEAVLKVVRPGFAPEFVSLSPLPFFMGRGSESGNHLLLEDPRISRRCAAIVKVEGGYCLEDRGHRQGVFVNGRRIARRLLADGDSIEFGLEDGCRIIFHSGSPGRLVEGTLARMDELAGVESRAGAAGLDKLQLLLEATSLLHSSLPLEAVLGSMLDHALAVTDGERALLLEPDTTGNLSVKQARGSGGVELPHDAIAPSQTALREAVEQRLPVITDDLTASDKNLQSAHSVVMQGLRAVTAIPLYAAAHARNKESVALRPAKLLGVLYLDSRRVAAFSDLDRQILDVLSAQAASILDNARLLEREREQRRLEQELAIARDIQQGLTPQGTRTFPHLAVSGVQVPCHAVGGDYFDVFPLDDQSAAFLIADVAGKGLGAALVTTLLKGAISGMRLGVGPAKVFAHVNRFLCEHAALGRCATMFFATVDAAGTLQYLHAGHPSPLLIRNGQVSDLYREGSLPVGLLEGAEFSASEALLEPGDMLLLYTDGIVEAENPQRELFGFERLRAVASAHAREPIEHLQGAILNAVKEFARGAGQADDITLLIVQYRKLAAA